jgi:hypothetical protein
MLSYSLVAAINTLLEELVFELQIFTSLHLKCLNQITKLFPKKMLQNTSNTTFVGS